MEVIRQSDPAAAADLEHAFASTDVMAAIEAELDTKGLTITNVADAYATYWMISWLAVFDPLAEFDRTQAQAVRRQAAAAPLATPGIAGLSDAEKQEMAEVTLVQAALITSSIEPIRGDPAALQACVESIRVGSLASGLDLGRMRLTDAGFLLTAN